MKNLLINLIKTILVVFLAPFFILFSTIKEILEIGGQIFDEIIKRLKN